MSHTERRPLTTHEEFEATKTDLEAYLSGSEVGNPRFMAFWDLVDLEVAEIELNRLEAANARYLGAQINRAAVALARDRISGRSSEVPGYYTSSAKIKGFVETLSRAPASFRSTDYLTQLRDRIATS